MDILKIIKTIGISVILFIVSVLAVGIISVIFFSRISLNPFHFIFTICLYLVVEGLYLYYIHKEKSTAKFTQLSLLVIGITWGIIAPSSLFISAFGGKEGVWLVYSFGLPTVLVSLTLPFVHSDNLFVLVLFSIVYANVILFGTWYVLKFLRSNKSS